MLTTIYGIVHVIKYNNDTITGLNTQYTVYSHYV